MSLHYRKAFLIDYLRAHPNGVPTCRVSSAQAKGAAKLYSYWGVALYRVRLSADGQPVHVCTRRAGSDRRTRDGAMQDATATGRLVLCSLGRLTDAECELVVTDLVRRDPRYAR